MSFPRNVCCANSNSVDLPCLTLWIFLLASLHVVLESSACFDIEIVSLEHDYDIMSEFSHGLAQIRFDQAQ